jgi:hypothetical protein
MKNLIHLNFIELKINELKKTVLYLIELIFRNVKQKENKNK